MRIEARYRPYAGPAHPAQPSRGAGAAGGRPGAVGTTQSTADPTVSPRGTPVDAATERPGGRDGSVTVLAHGFTGSCDRPAVLRAAELFAQHTAVVTFSFRGHGRSSGRSTVGDLEVFDLAAAVQWARSLGHRHVNTVGFSMGGSVVVRHAALFRSAQLPTRHQPEQLARTALPAADANPASANGSSGTAVAADVQSTGTATAAEAVSAHTDTAVAVSAPARWHYHGTAPMRRLHLAVQNPVGRLFARYALGTRIHPSGWNPEPLSPVITAPDVAPTPLLIVHGDRDRYFPLDHPRSLADAADAASTALWIVPGFGHAENAAEPALLHRIAAWNATASQPPGGKGHHGTRGRTG